MYDEKYKIYIASSTFRLGKHFFADHWTQMGFMLSYSC